MTIAYWTCEHCWHVNSDLWARCQECLNYRRSDDEETEGTK